MCYYYILLKGPATQLPFEAVIPQEISPAHIPVVNSAVIIGKGHNCAFNEMLPKNTIIIDKQDFNIDIGQIYLKS